MMICVEKKHLPSDDRSQLSKIVQSRSDVEKFFKQG